MLKAFGALDNRLHAQGRRCFEPSGQDGYNCLLLAAIDQLRLLGFALDRDRGAAHRRSAASAAPLRRLTCLGAAAAPPRAAAPPKPHLSAA